MKKLAGSLTKTYRKKFEYPVVSVLRLQGTITAQRGEVMTDRVTSARLGETTVPLIFRSKLSEPGGDSEEDRGRLQA